MVTYKLLKLHYDVFPFSDGVRRCGPSGHDSSNKMGE